MIIIQNKIKVCDAIMGQGKSSSAITYMNEHPDKRFVYIAPYLSEAKRIHDACPLLNFCEPKRKSEFCGSKLLDTADLISKGMNVATTHQAFKFYPDEILGMIRNGKYTLIIDEDVNVLQEVDEDAASIRMAIDAKYIQETSPGVYSLVKDVYDGVTHKNFFSLMRSRDLTRSKDVEGADLYYWKMPEELLTAFDDVFILTYLFEGQDLCFYMKMNNIPYEYIGVSRDQDGTFRFSDKMTYIPEYTHHLSDMIHVVDNNKLNNIGNTRYALSLSWFKNNSDKVETLKKNVYNYFHNVVKATTTQCMWSTYKTCKERLKGLGYTNGFVPFNTKATNEYKDKSVLAYCVNLYMNVGQKMLYEDLGVHVDEDLYALSYMVQWIWRSAIRDGKEITIYIPSSRMRGLLLNWIENVERGADASVQEMQALPVEQ